MPPSIFRYSFSAMGTDCNLSIYTTNETLADHTSDLVMAEVWRIENKYSRYTDDSTLAEINRAALLGKQTEIDNETAMLFDYADNAFRISGGLFDITSGVLRQIWNFSTTTLPTPSSIENILPLIGLQKIVRDQTQLRFSISGMELDFGGICKEYAVDRSVDICRNIGITAGLIDLGGDIRAIGLHPDSQTWQIGLQHPRKPDHSLGMIELLSGAVATSGDYERYMDVAGKRYSHIFNPQTGWPVEGLISVTVMAEQCMMAGTLSTIALLKGNAGKQWLKELGVKHCWVDEQLRFGGNLTLGPKNKSTP